MHITSILYSKQVKINYLSLRFIIYLGAECNSCVRNEYRFVLYYMVYDFFYRHPEFMEKLE